MSEANKENTQNFEQMLQKLDSIVRLLESGSLTLEKSLEAFQEGVGLVKECQTMLSQAEQKVEVLIKATQEGVQTKPLNTDENTSR